MWITRCCGLVVAGMGLVAQNPPGPVAIEGKLDTPQVRVYIATLTPHAPVPSKTGHATDRVLIYLDDGKMTVLDVAAGTTQTIEFHRGDVRWRPASGAYTAENVTDHKIRIMEIDLKGKPAGPLPVTKLDPVTVDPKHYKVDFENDKVRVLRIHFEAHDKAPQHEHILNRVVMNLNDQTSGKADEVHISGASVHTEENTGDQAADRIAVEMK